MKYLLDTPLLIWIASERKKVPAAVTALIDDPSHTLFWSSAGLWEVAMKFALGRSDFHLDPEALRLGLLTHGYAESQVFIWENGHQVSSFALHR